MAPLFERISHQHGADGKQAERGKPIHGEGPGRL
jgi:hypothetical protein